MRRAETSCPLPKAHNRLRQTHDLWHESAAAYPDVDEFVTKLNACVQAARSVTFVLQKELSKSDWFSAWYGAWQERMRADPKMKWLVEARNEIEKEGDLDTKSVARVSVAATDGEQLIAEVEVPPLMGPEEAAAAIKLPELPEGLKKHGVMVIERRWMVAALPDEELLDALAHCYGILAQIIREAHEHCNVDMRTFGGETHEGRHVRLPHPSGRLPCMVTTEEMRRAYWHLGTETLMEFVQKNGPGLTRQQLEADGPALQEHYGALPHHRLAPGATNVDEARVMHEWGKRILVVDGYHRTLAWTARGDGAPTLHVVDYEDEQEKVVQMRLLAEEIERQGADRLIFATEIWTAPAVPPEDARSKLRPGERDDRTEAFVTYALSRGEPLTIFSTHFSRPTADTIELGETDESEITEMPIFGPILRVWDKWDDEPPAGRA